MKSKILWAGFLLLVSAPVFAQQPQLNKLKAVVIDIDNRLVRFDYEYIITGTTNVTQQRLYQPVTTQISDINQYTATPANEATLPVGGVAADSRTIDNNGAGYSVPASGTYSIRLILSYGTQTATYDRQFSIWWDTPESCIPPNVWDTSEQRCELPNGTPISVEITNPPYDPGESWYGGLTDKVESIKTFILNFWDTLDDKIIEIQDWFVSLFTPSQGTYDGLISLKDQIMTLEPFGSLATAVNHQTNQEPTNTIFDFEYFWWPVTYQTSGQWVNTEDGKRWVRTGNPIHWDNGHNIAPINNMNNTSGFNFNNIRNFIKWMMYFTLFYFVIRRISPRTVM